MRWESESWIDIIDRESTMRESGRLSPLPILDQPQTTSLHSSQQNLPISPSPPVLEGQSSQEKPSKPNPKPIFPKDKVNRSFGASNDNPRLSYNASKKKP